jgi:hypothetical protein
VEQYLLSQGRPMIPYLSHMRTEIVGDDFVLSVSPDHGFSVDVVEEDH